MLVLMDHLPYLVHTLSIRGVYVYDIYISVPSSYDTVNALGQQVQNQTFIWLISKTKLLEGHFFCTDYMSIRIKMVDT